MTFLYLNPLGRTAALLLGLMALGCTTKTVTNVTPVRDAGRTAGRGGAGGRGGSTGPTGVGGEAMAGGGGMTTMPGSLPDGGSRGGDAPVVFDGPRMTDPVPRTDASCPAVAPAVKKGLGLACACNIECGSGFCVDGVCCNLACSGACVSCNLAGKMGECAPVAVAAPDPHSICKKEDPSTCSQDGTCNGLGGCAKFKTGTMCKPSACSGGELIPASICNGNGTCIVGNPIACAPYACIDNACRASCTNSADCATPNLCRDIPGLGLSCGKKMLGQDCKLPVECASNFCADGVCCDSGCSGKCMYCKSPDKRGRCTPVAADVGDQRAAAGVTDPTKICVDQGSTSCGTNGKCNGNGGCQTYSNGTVCRAESCDAATSRYNSEGVCQNGSCAVSDPLVCAPYKCNGARCATGCTVTDQCQVPRICQAGECGKKPVGSICGAGTECGSGFCAQGACCATACKDSCYSCGLAGSRGTCKPVAKNVRDPQGQCQDQGPASCGTDGFCDGTGRCRFYANTTNCVQGTCTDGVATLPSKCDGKGKCTGQGNETCAPYVCSQQGSCFTSCTTTGGQCAVGKACDPQNSCGKNALGSRCVQGPDCLSGNCVDGRCCGSASCGTCKVCGTKGTCDNVALGDVDPRAVCKAAADPTTCGNNGFCDGNGACQNFGAEQSCAVQTCPDGASQGALDSFCNGKGACDTKVQKCGNYKCDGATKQCRSSCTADADCITGVGCEMTTVGGMTTGVCGTKQPIGATCSGDIACASGNCVDGVCCNTKCTDLCKSCGQSNSLGICTFVGDNNTDDTCKDFRNGSRECGDGACQLQTGTPVCRFKDAASACGARCGDVAMNEAAIYSKKCNAAGACGGAETAGTCGAYQCQAGMAGGGATCQLQCDFNNPNSCWAGYKCVKQMNGTGNVGVCLRAPGQGCTTNAQCATAVCWKRNTTDTSGVCCDKACAGSCSTCDTGTCQACGSTQKCGCATGQSCSGTPASNICKAEAGQACTTNGNCLSDVCVGGFCCKTGSTCTGETCNRCESGTGNCVLNCTATQRCVNGATGVAGSCKKVQGQACAAAGECASNYCGDNGKCCDAGCTGDCQACDANGTCQAILNGANGARCPIQMPTTFDSAACSLKRGCANGICARSGADVRCSGFSCTADGKLAASFCNGAEACVAGTPATCALNQFCEGGSCGAKKDNGQDCADDSQCTTGYCVMMTATTGRCCAARCNPTQCESVCAAGGAAGTCVNNCSAAQLCEAGSGGTAGSCKTRQGLACTSPTECSGTLSCVATSPGGVAKVCCSASCNESGCNACKSDGTGCEYKCGGGQYCAAGGVGVAGSCATKKGNGTACTGAGECSSGICFVESGMTAGICCGVSCAESSCAKCSAAGTACESKCDGSTQYCANAVPVGSCATRKTAGMACLNDAECLGLCQSSTCRSTTGQGCAMTSQCVSGLHCASGGTCQLKKAKAAACTVADECSTGMLCESTTLGGTSKICCETATACNGAGCMACKTDGTGCETKCGMVQFCKAATMMCQAKGALGAACMNSLECLAGTCEGSVCKATTGQMCPGGVGDCAMGLICDAGVCAGKKAKGGSCSATADCTTGLTCLATSPGGAAKVCCMAATCGENICEACAGTGEACVATCMTNQYCVAGMSMAAGMCAVKKLPGDVCVLGGECASGICDGTCRTASGGACPSTAFTFCVAGNYCDTTSTSTCKPKLATGSACPLMTECLGNCEGGLCKSVAGQGCTVATDCAGTTLYCDTTCKAKRPFGSACPLGTECQGACEAAVCKSTVGQSCAVVGDCALTLSCDLMLKCAAP